MLPLADITTIPEGASLDDKMDIVLSLLLKQTKQLTLYEEKITSLEKENKSLRSSVNVLSKEVHNLKTSANHREQQTRGCSVRLLGLSMAEDEQGSTDGGKALATRIYEKILKPILIAATTATASRTKGAVPGCASIIEDCYRVGRPGADRSKPPPVVIRFCSKQIRLTILRFKKAAMPAPPAADIAAGIKRYIVVEDLTRDSHRMLKSLGEDARVDKVWTIDGTIRFTLANDATHSVKRVKSVYDSIDAVITSAS
jgi:hypothetical protein